MFSSLETFVFIWGHILVVALFVWLYLKIKKENTDFEVIVGIAGLITLGLFILYTIIYVILKSLKVI